MQLERNEAIMLLSLQKARQRSLSMLLKMASLHRLDILSERENSPVLKKALYVDELAPTEAN